MQRITIKLFSVISYLSNRLLWQVELLAEWTKWNIMFLIHKRQLIWVECRNWKCIWCGHIRERLVPSIHYFVTGSMRKDHPTNAGLPFLVVVRRDDLIKIRIPSEIELIVLGILLFSCRGFLGLPSIIAAASSWAGTSSVESTRGHGFLRDRRRRTLQTKCYRDYNGMNPSWSRAYGPKTNTWGVSPRESNPWLLLPIGMKQLNAFTSYGDEWFEHSPPLRCRKIALIYDDGKRWC